MIFILGNFYKYYYKLVYIYPIKFLSFVPVKQKKLIFLKNRFLLQINFNRLEYNFIGISLKNKVNKQSIVYSLNDGYFSKVKHRKNYCKLINVFIFIIKIFFNLKNILIIKINTFINLINLKFNLNFVKRFYRVFKYKFLKFFFPFRKYKNLRGL